MGFKSHLFYSAILLLLLGQAPWLEHPEHPEQPLLFDFIFL
ncbi:hypothetical protein H477_4707 [[Clostridium] sordellii ATCC 9714]|nr:hypothetical protein H477_4707 [[Clostridium] sordellii ATCC 9714] [Paeniclostridium sordellii ATCC 9714]